MSANGTIRVLVAEDERPLLDAICALVEGEEGMEVVGAAQSADEAIVLAERTQPDVALVDVRMHGRGPVAAEGINSRAPSTRVLALSAYEDQATVLEMMSAGAVGYLVKGISPVEIVEAIQRAARGQASISIDVITGVIDELVSSMSERGRVAEVLKQSEDRFRGLVESAPDAVVIVDSKGRIVLVNAHTEELFGYPRKELLGKAVELLLPERFHAPRVGHRAGYLAGLKTRAIDNGLELAGRRLDGTEFPIDLSLSAVDTEQGPLTTAFIRAVTEQNAAEEGRSKSEERLAALLEAAPDAIVISDSVGRIVLVNAQTEETFGYTRAELLGKPIDVLVPDRHRARHAVHREDYIAHPRTRAMESGLDLTGRRKDGTEFPLDISLNMVATEHGRFVTAFVRDLTDRHHGFRAMRDLAAILESSDDAIIGNSLDGTILTWNPGAEQMYGYSASEIVGKSISILIPRDHPDELPEILAALKRGEEVAPFEARRLRKDGVEIDASTKIFPISDSRGRVVGASTIARDITQVKAHAALERELAERRALVGHLVAAGEKERAQIAGDIHDDSIQAITAAGMRLQILRRKLDDPEHIKLLGELEETIQLSISRLRHLLFELRPPVLDNEGLSAAVELYLDETAGETATHYRLENKLRSQPPPETRAVIYRIVQEAVTNARKHAEASSVTVGLEEQDDGFLASIVDDGVGFQVEESQQVPGHLGLAAMRERAVLAGGWLRITSAPGHGTTVDVWVPAEPEVAGTDAAPVAAA
jgi:PAS domain S-box-containing protein